MPFSEHELKRYKKITDRFIEKRRPPVDIRDEVDLRYKIHDYSAEIFEIRRLWNDPAKKIEVPVAKAKYVKKNNSWEIFWQRADLKWHRYDPNPKVDSLEEFLKIVDEDKFACFWG